MRANSVSKSRRGAFFAGDFFFFLGFAITAAAAGIAAVCASRAGKPARSFSSR